MKRIAILVAMMAALFTGTGSPAEAIDIITTPHEAAVSVVEYNFVGLLDGSTATIGRCTKVKPKVWTCPGEAHNKVTACTMTVVVWLNHRGFWVSFIHLRCADL